MSRRVIRDDYRLSMAAVRAVGGATQRLRDGPSEVWAQVVA